MIVFSYDSLEYCIFYNQQTVGHKRKELNFTQDMMYYAYNKQIVLNIISYCTNEKLIIALSAFDTRGQDSFTLLWSDLPTYDVPNTKFVDNLLLVTIFCEI